MKKNIIIGLMLVGTNIGLSFGQVAIGGGALPAEGALLDLKEKAAAADNVTASKGLLMPRVMLTDLTSLEPLVKNATAANKKEHIGLQVYHIGGGTNEIKPGLKIWEGEKWSEYYAIDKTQWVYLPPLDLNLATSGIQKIDLVDRYERGIGNAGDGIKLWPTDKRDYQLITWDKKSFKSIKIVRTAPNKIELVYELNLANINSYTHAQVIVINRPQS